MTLITTVVPDYRASLRDEGEETPNRQSKQKPLAPRSILVYMTHLNTFVRWCATETPTNARVLNVTELTPRLLRRYQRCLEASRRPRTVIQTIYALRRFFVWCIEEGYLSSDPTEGMVLPQPDASSRSVPSPAMVSALLAAPPRISGTPARKALAAALLCIFAFAGLRRNEALSLRLCDFNRRDRTLYIRRGKGNKERTVIIGEKTVQAILCYIELRPTTSSEYMFMFNVQMRFGTGALTALMADLRDACDFPKEASLQPHSLRHSYASRMAQSGVDLKTIQEQLGHSNLTTTQEYLHTTTEQKHSAARIAETIEQAEDKPLPNPHDPTHLPNTRPVKWM